MASTDNSESTVGDAVEIVEASARVRLQQAISYARGLEEQLAFVKGSASSIINMSVLKHGERQHLLVLLDHIEISEAAVGMVIESLAASIDQLVSKPE